MTQHSLRRAPRDSQFQGTSAIARVQQLGNQIAYRTMLSSLLLDGRVYQQIRDGVVKATIPTTFHSSLVGSFRDRLASSLLVRLFGCTDQELVEDFATVDLEATKTKCVGLQQKITELDECEQQFKLLRLVEANSSNNHMVSA